MIYTKLIFQKFSLILHFLQYSIIQMIRTQIDRASNPKLKSFLSPFRYGIRSVSTSESHPNFSTGLQSQKSYIDFRRAPEYKPSTKPSLKIQVQDFNKKQIKKQKKLLKFSMNRHREKQENKYIKLESQQIQNEWQKNNDILCLVRQLKQKVMALESQNKKLKEMQEPNERRIKKQDQIIRNLEQALYLTRGHPSYSVGSLYKQNKVNLSCTRVIRPQKDISNNISYECLEIKIAELAQQNNKLQSQCFKLQNQIKMMTKNQQNMSGDDKQGCKICNKINISSIQSLLTQIEAKKRKQFQQINNLLFETNNIF